MNHVSAKMATTLQDLTVFELKDVLRWLNLRTSDNKAELIVRVYEKDRNDTWVNYVTNKDAPHDYSPLEKNIQAARKENEVLMAKL